MRPMTKERWLGKYRQIPVAKQTKKLAIKMTEASSRLEDEVGEDNTRERSGHSPSIIFSHGCNIDSAKVVSNHNRFLHRNAPNDDSGAR